MFGHSPRIDERLSLSFRTLTPRLCGGHFCTFESIFYLARACSTYLLVACKFTCAGTKPRVAYEFVAGVISV